MRTKTPLKSEIATRALGMCVPHGPSFGGPENTFFAKTSGEKLFLRQTPFDLV